jgi:hypothetical protein
VHIAAGVLNHLARSGPWEGLDGGGVWVQARGEGVINTVGYIPERRLDEYLDELGRPVQVDQRHPSSANDIFSQDDGSLSPVVHQ